MPTSAEGSQQSQAAAASMASGALQPLPVEAAPILGPAPAAAQHLAAPNLDQESSQDVEQGQEAHAEADEELESGWETASEAAITDAGAEDSGDGVEEEPLGEPLPDMSDPVMKGFKEYGCEHYRRRCKLVAPCCGEVVWCRHCHNLLKSDNEEDPKKRHVLDRKAVKEVICALCDTRQPPAKQCVSCGVGFGLFACLTCRFYDDDISKQQFHCDKCGICRVGGREHYFHCDTCNCCYAMGLRDTHVCIENSMHHNCPVCFEYLFDSIKPINVMPCGHTIHQECLRSMAEHHTYTCPVCNKSYMTQAHRQRLWGEMDTAVAQTPMPEQYRDMQVAILCNDCNKRCTVAFHVVGHKCAACGGYNTCRV